MTQTALKMACPQCDTLHEMAKLEPNLRARCVRCSHVLATSRVDAISKVLALALAATILMFAALLFPFLTIKVGGSSNQMSILDAVLAFSGNILLPAALFVAALIIVIPIARLCALIYALLPLVLGWRPFAHAIHAFRFAEALRPWSMVEIFVVGVAVSMVKVAGLAAITLGPAFWAVAMFVLVTVLKDSYICRWTIWSELERS